MHNEAEGHPTAKVQLTCFALDGSWRHQLFHETKRVVLASGIIRPFIPDVKAEVETMLETDTLPGIKTWGGPVVISYEGTPLAWVAPAVKQ